MKAKISTIPAGVKFADDGRILLSSAKCAEFFDVSDWTIRDWGAKGCPQEERGWWDIKAVNTWLGKGRPEDGQPKSDAARKLLAEAELKEQQVQKAKRENEVSHGLYIPKPDVVAEWTRRIIELKTGLLAMARKAAGQFSDPDVRVEVEKIISDEAYNLLKQYSRDGKYTPAVKAGKVKTSKTAKKTGKPRKFVTKQKGKKE